MGLSDSERILMMRSAVLIQYTSVTDRRTDRQTDGIGVAYTRYSIYAAVAQPGFGFGWVPPTLLSCLPSLPFLLSLPILPSPLYSSSSPLLCPFLSEPGRQIVCGAFCAKIAASRTIVFKNFCFSESRRNKLFY